MTTINPLGTETFRTYAYDDEGRRWYCRDLYSHTIEPLYRLKVRPWIPHDGGPCPVEPHVRVRVRTKWGWTSRDSVSAGFWCSGGDCSGDHWRGATDQLGSVIDRIIAYQIIED